MEHHPDERNQLATLHDRNKRFSIEVYDHQESGDTEKLKEAQENLKKAKKELKALTKRLLP